MHLLNAIATLSLAGTSVALGRRATPTTNDGTTPEIKRFIVEFAGGSDHHALADEIGAREGTTVLKVFDSHLFSGVAVESPDENIDTLQGIENVSKVWHNKIVQLSPTIGFEGFSDDATARKYGVHRMTGVDKLQASGVLGKGAIVGIVDTGTDYTHTALGGGFGPGYKVAKGYDYIGDSYWPQAGWDKKPDGDPIDTLGHGTHVAGIFGANSPNFKGVAPEATIYSYKVFGNVDATDDATLIEAFLQAESDGVDIITSSIGGYGGWSDNAWATVASRIAETGIVVTIAAGNWGSEGVFFPNSGSSGDNVIAVASVEGDTLVAAPFEATFTLDGQSNTTIVGYQPGWLFFPPEVNNWPIYPLSLDLSDASIGCSPLPEDTGDLSNVVLLIPKGGGCEFADKQINLAAYGGYYVLFYNDDEPLRPPTTTYHDHYYGLAEKKVGIAIIETIKAGGSVTANFSLDPYEAFVGADNEFGGLINGFTALGGTYDLKIKPDIAAPGGGIFSTYPGNRFVVMGGTSMATPYVAGVAALYVGKYGGKSVHGPGFGKSLSARISAGGNSIKWSDGQNIKDYGVWAPVWQIGTGLINATKVLDYTTSISWEKFALNDTRHHSRYHSVDITNSGTKPVTYTFSIEPAGGYESLDDSNIPIIKSGPGYALLLPETFNLPKVKYPSGTFTVKSGQTKKAEFVIEYPEGLNSAKLPIYSGKILISGNNGEVLAVPYLGVGGDIKAAFDDLFEEGFPFGFSGLSKTSFTEKPGFTFNHTLEGQDYPRIQYRLRWGSEQVRWDIFEADWKERSWKYPPVVGFNGYVGSATTYATADQKNFDPSSQNENDLISFPIADIFRASKSQATPEFWWLTGKLADGTIIQPGKYTIRFAALRPFGSPERSDNWDVFSSKIEVLG